MTEEQKLPEAPAQANESEHQEEENSAPTSRATINKNKTKAMVPRIFDKNAKVLMRRSSTEPFEFYMLVTDFEYDAERDGWDYWLKEDNTMELSWPKMVKETNLKRRR